MLISEILSFFWDTLYISHFAIFMFQLSVQMCENGCGGGLPVSEAGAERPGSNFPQVALSLIVRAQFTYVYNSLFRISGWQVALCSLTESQHNANIEPCLQPHTHTHIHKKKLTHKKYKSTHAKNTNTHTQKYIYTRTHTERNIHQLWRIQDSQLKMNSVHTQALTRPRFTTQYKQCSYLLLFLEHL